MELSSEEKIILLETARNSIKNLFTKTEIAEPDYDKFPLLKSKAGAFVTLTINSRLRGCIGYITSDNPLFETVKDAAVQAAVGDPRFMPLTEKEFENVDVEVSILSEPFKMNSYDEIVLGKHGLILDDMGRRGLLLPQVPAEHNMDKEQYLCAICEKAGLPSFAWKERTLNINMFTANVFSEEQEM
jgi:AmmeMemoRadiSam system protein A